MPLSKETSSSDDTNWTYVPLDHSLSDGDKSTWPTDIKFGRPDDSLYREKVAKMWIHKRDEYKPGENYILEKLPEGYALFDRPRPSNLEIRDKYLWGHPSGAYFNSPNRFFPHFYWFMTGRKTQCQCDLCINQRKKMDPHSQPKMKGKEKEKEENNNGEGSSLGEHRRNPPTLFPVDLEGHPDVWKMAIHTLKEEKELAIKIKESDSIEWRVEKKRLSDYLVALDMQPSWVPRAGEIVMWIPHLTGVLRFNKDADCIQMYDPEEKKWLGVPEWRAGTVGQVPETDPVVFEDIEKTTKKTWAVNYSGFRVETFPDPNALTKDYSLQFRYVHLTSIKPFTYWGIFLSGVPISDWHPSIRFALTVMSSYSLIGKHAFAGEWPHASIYCHGIWIGSELYVVGDAVRLKPQGYTFNNKVGKVTDVMVITDIRMDLTNCIDDVNSPLLARKHSARLEGHIYTLFPDRAYREEGDTEPPIPMTYDEVIQAFNYVGMEGWGKWYRTHKEDLEAEASQDMVIGRIYDPEALKLFVLTDNVDLGMDLECVVNSRRYSRDNDERLPPGLDWFWGNSRLQSLALDSLNGHDVEKYSDARLPKMWRAILKCVDGDYTKSDLRDAMIPMDRGRPLAGNDKSSFAEVGKTSKLVSSGLGGTERSTDASSEDEDDEDSEDSDEDEDEGDDEDNDSMVDSDENEELKDIPYM